MVRVAAKKERRQLIVLHASLAPSTSDVGRGAGSDAGAAMRTHKASRVAAELVRALQDYLARLGGIRYAAADLLSVQSAVYDTDHVRKGRAAVSVAETAQDKQAAVEVAGVALRLVVSVKNTGRGGGNAWQNLLRTCCVCVNQVRLPSARHTAPVSCAAALRVVRFTTHHIMSTRPLPVDWFESTCQLPPTTPIAPRAQPAIFVPATLLPLSSTGSVAEEAAVSMAGAHSSSTRNSSPTSTCSDSGQRAMGGAHAVPPYLFVPPPETVSACHGHTPSASHGGGQGVARASLLRCVSVPSEAHVAVAPLPSGQNMRCGELCFVPLEVHENTRGTGGASLDCTAAASSLSSSSAARAPHVASGATLVVQDYSPAHSPCPLRRETTQSSSASLSSSVTTLGSAASATTAAGTGAERAVSHVLVPVVMLAAPAPAELSAVPLTPSWCTAPPLYRDPAARLLPSSSASSSATTTTCTAMASETHAATSRSGGGASGGPSLLSLPSQPPQAVPPLMTAIQRRPMCLVSTPPCPPRVSPGQMHVACRALPPEEADMECMICLEGQLPGRQEGGTEAAAGQTRTGPGRARQDRRMVRLSCAHCFHVVCLQRWLLHATHCPLCRRDLAPTSQS